MLMFTWAVKYEAYLFDQCADRSIKCFLMEQYTKWQPHWETIQTDKCMGWSGELLGKSVILVQCLMTQRCMMTSSNGNIFRVTGPLWEEFTGDRWIPLTKASDAELWCFLWSAPQQTVELTSRRRWFETPSRSLWRHWFALAHAWVMTSHISCAEQSQGCQNQSDVFREQSTLLHRPIY